MRILDYYPACTWRECGPMTHMLSVADALGSVGHEVLLVTNRPFRPVSGQFKLLAMPSRPFQMRRMSIGPRSRRALLKILLRFWKPDYLYHRFGADTTATELGERAGVPRILEFNGCPEGLAEFFQRDQDEATRRWKRLQLENAAGIVVVNAADQEHIQRFCPIEDERIIFAPNGFDPSLFAGVETRRRAAQTPDSSDDGELRVGDLTGYQVYEDLPLLMKAVALASEHVPKIELELAGLKPRALDLAEMARSAGLAPERLKVLGAVSHDEIGRWLASLHIVALVLKPDRVLENHGCQVTRLAEYWASGACVVATDTPDSLTYSHHEAGRLVAVPPGDAEALAQALVGLHRDPARRARIGEAGRAFAYANRTWRHVAERTTELIERHRLRNAEAKNDRNKLIVEKV